MKPNPISTAIDFDADGIQHGWLKLPHSDDRSAWGAIMTPVCVIKNAAGPTALLTGGNHGDEYEGPIALLNFCREIDLARVTGRIIVVPMMNYPALCAGKRTSPIDGGNMNRVFPGRPDGSPTEKTADYFYRQLLPLSDYVLDLHSGGKTLEFVPFASVHLLADSEQQRRCEAAMRAFAAPYNVVLLEQDAMGMYDTAAEQQGKVFVTTELGGGGSTCTATNRIAAVGVNGFLAHAGIVPPAPVSAASVEVDVPDADCFSTAEQSGLMQPLVDPGAQVKQDQPLCQIIPLHRSGAAVVVYRAKRDGILLGRHYPGLTRPGDTLALVGVPR